MYRRDKLSCGADEACKGTRIPAGILDGTIWKELKEHLRSPEKIIELYKSQSKLEGTTLHGRQRIENQEAIKRIKAEIKRLTDAYVEGFIEREDFAPRKRRLDLRLRELETEKIEIEEKAERLKNELLLFTDLKEFTKRIIERLETMDFFSRQSLVRELIEKVIVKDSKLEIHHRFPLPSGANLCPNSFYHSYKAINREYNQGLNLGWLMLEPDTPNKIEIDASKFSKNKKFSEVFYKVIDSAFFISDRLFSRIVNATLEVRTYVSINPVTRMAEEGALSLYDDYAVCENRCSIY